MTSPDLAELHAKFSLGLDKPPLNPSDEYVRGFRDACKEIVKDLAAALRKDSAIGVSDLVPGCTYASKAFGSATYIGPDDYMGQRTYKFSTPHGTRYMLPDAFDLTRFGAEQDSAATGAQGEAVAWVLFDKDSMLPVTASQPYATEPAPWIQKHASITGKVWRRVSTAPAPRGVPDSGKLWSFLRNVLEQGRTIQMDNAAGKYETYEHLSARIDEAARERADELEAALAAEQKEGT